MEINLIVVGSIKNKDIENLANTYLNKILHFTKIKRIIINEFKINNENDLSQIEKSLKEESKNINKFFSIDAYSFVLAIEGKNITSEEFSKNIENKINSSQYKKINFIIGSSHGLSNEIKKNANELISFSKMTFPHQLFQVLLLEQIYRSFTIIKNIKYHK